MTLKKLGQGQIGHEIFQLHNCMYLSNHLKYRFRIDNKERWCHSVILADDLEKLGQGQISLE